MYCNLNNLSLKAYDNNDQMIPFQNIYNINTSAEYPYQASRSNIQSLGVNLKKYDPLSGLFDYVIFSEKSIVKDIGAYTGGWFSEEIYISDPSPLVINVGEVYSHVLTVVNGYPEYSWSHSGELPTGISFNNGVLQGSATQTGNNLVKFIVIDSKGKEASKEILLLVK